MDHGRPVRNSRATDDTSDRADPQARVHSADAAVPERLARPPIETAGERGYECGNRPRMVARPVLVVDDDPDTRHLMMRVLSSEGYTVATASNGREALKIWPILSLS